jgi:hypothetical protein
VRRPRSHLLGGSLSAATGRIADSTVAFRDINALAVAIQSGERSSGDAAYADRAISTPRRAQVQCTVGKRYCFAVKPPREERFLHQETPCVCSPYDAEAGWRRGATHTGQHPAGSLLPASSRRRFLTHCHDKAASGAYCARTPSVTCECPYTRRGLDTLRTVDAAARQIHGIPRLSHPAPHVRTSSELNLLPATDEWALCARGSYAAVRAR